MKYPVFLCLLFLTLQLFLVFKGVAYFGIFTNPFLLLGSFIGLFIVYLRSVKNIPASSPSAQTSYFSILAFAGGATAVLLCFPAFGHMFHIIPDPGSGSDVIPQLETQFDRFCSGAMPYQQVNLHQSNPFPVYMPFHWLPVAISRFAGIDTRWSGLLCAGAAARKGLPLMMNIAIVILPSCVLLVCLYGGDLDLTLSLETIIAAYYLVLSAGLLQKNLFIVTAGLALCMLSRYTLIFWLPVFLFLLFLDKGYATTTRVILTLTAVVCLCYVFPFLLKDPSIFMKGLKYHNGAAGFEWKYGAITFSTGIYFAPHINALVPGSYPHKILVARIFQAATMLFLCFGGIWYDKRIRNKVSHYDYSLGMLYLFLVGFYMIGPLTYRYYMVTPLLLSAVLCMKIMQGRAKSSKTSLHITEFTPSLPVPAVFPVLQMWRGTLWHSSA